jgi:rRNA biogenesis protein RRP5
MTGAIKSVEDHGYILETGIPDLSGFLSKKDAEKAGLSVSEACLGRLLDLCVTKVSGNGRTCNVNIDSETFKTAAVSLHYIRICRTWLNPS